MASEPFNDTTVQHNGDSNGAGTKTRASNRKRKSTDAGNKEATNKTSKKKKSKKDEKMAEMDKENASLRAQLAALQAAAAEQDRQTPGPDSDDNEDENNEDEDETPPNRNNEPQGEGANVPARQPTRRNQASSSPRLRAPEPTTPGTNAPENTDATQSNGNIQAPAQGSDRKPRPKGSKWSISVEMDLAGSTAKRLKYNTFTVSSNSPILREILTINIAKRNIRDLSLQGNLPWHVEWRDVPSGQLERVCEVAADKMPYLAQFDNHWATKAIIKQWMGNKRSYAYRTGTLKPNPKYQYLANNAAKRGNAPGSRKKRATRVYEAKKAKKAAWKQKKRDARGDKDQQEFVQGS
ncbi:hypothetical protein AAF712_014836 [Marasmius tenuissimus]|uniref:Uncharacterized protein n=1 Tax=Marasmius tenuissimus TaxID=585030 RepID=A0ABR2ZC54_9AGAR